MVLMKHKYVENVLRKKSQEKNDSMGKMFSTNTKIISREKGCFFFFLNRLTLYIYRVRQKM